jgi:hypothetical protein
MATVDANCKFITIDVGSMRRFSDANIFSSSVLAKKLKKQTFQLPLPALLPNVEDPLPYVFVGDEAFPLLENLMRVLPGTMKMKIEITDFHEHGKLLSALLVY